MTLLYFCWNSLWFGWKFFWLERNCHLFFLQFLPDHSYSLVISLAQFTWNYLPHKPPSSWKTWNANHSFLPLFCAWAWPAANDTWLQGLCARKLRWWLTIVLPCLLSRIKFIMDQVANVKFWSRSDVSTCSCSQKSYRHVHCHRSRSFK